ncbi:MAG: hypothetical protein N4A33_00830 [Bacteriovoracaceae bacterium]|nr:hypothetical protein [Bacteriovoracaceae bacterium]
MTLLFSSCESLFKAESGLRKDDPTAYYGTGKGLIITKNPIAAGVGSLDFDNLTYPRKVTENNTLSDLCYFTQTNIALTTSTTQNCISIYNDDKAGTTPLTNNTGSWVYGFGTDEFYQVNTYYHVNEISKKFLNNLGSAHNLLFSKLLWTNPVATKFDLVSTKGFWVHSNGYNNTLKVMSKIEYSGEHLNASYNPAEKSVEFGYNPALGVRMVEDPTIIYHEMGHVFVDILLNQRNIWMNGVVTNSSPYSARFGRGGGYDEANAIGEGLADFFTYYMTKRTRMGEWGLGLLFNAARPLSEDDSLHHALFTSTEKLSYPKHNHYDPNNRTAKTESIYNTALTTSHYLTALHKNLQTYCSFPSNTTGLSTSDYKHQKANEYMILLLSETLAELGDLRAKGSDFFDGNNANFSAISESSSFEDLYNENPINYRSFYKTFAKNIHHNITGYLCPSFSKSHNEGLLDQYGLLLFNDYGDAGDGIETVSHTNIDYDDITISPLTGMSVNLSSPATSQTVDEIHRINSIRISKELISLPALNSGLAQAYLFDDPSEIASYLSLLNFKGANVNTSTGLAGTQYNYKNNNIGPGEIIGLGINLINNSNSPMSGVQIIGTDWDHLKLDDNSKRYVNRFFNQNTTGPDSNIATFKPCQFDGFPLLSEGAVTDSTTNQGDCEFNTKTKEKIELDGNGNQMYPLDAPQPICLVKYSDDNEQTWVTQDFFRKNQLNLDDNNCLDNATSGDSFNPNHCLARVLPGASTATYGKIDPSQTWAQTVNLGTSDQNSYGLGNIIMMEINKETPPGTVFSCRFRVRMSNCSDCYTDSNGNEYKKSDFSSYKPFKIINFEFTVRE